MSGHSKKQLIWAPGSIRFIHLQHTGKVQFKSLGMSTDTCTLLGYHHSKHGRFSTMPQYPEKPSDRFSISTLSQCPRPLESPGPMHYDNSHRRTTSAPIRFPSAKRFDGRAHSGSTVSPTHLYCILFSHTPFMLQRTQWDLHSTTLIVGIRGDIKMATSMSLCQEPLDYHRVWTLHRRGCSGRGSHPEAWQGTIPSSLHEATTV